MILPNSGAAKKNWWLFRVNITCMFTVLCSLFHQISDDMNYILSQIEKQDGIQSGQEEEMIRVLWNKREIAYKQLRDWELQLKELRLEDNNIVDGLKVGEGCGDK